MALFIRIIVIIIFLIIVVSYTWSGLRGSKDSLPDLLIYQKYLKTDNPFLQRKIRHISLGMSCFWYIKMPESYMTYSVMFRNLKTIIFKRLFIQCPCLSVSNSGYENYWTLAYWTVGLIFECCKPLNEMA